MDHVTRTEPGNVCDGLRTSVHLFWKIPSTSAESDSTDLTPNLLFDALLRLGQSWHRRHVRPTERTHHRLQGDISEELLHMCEEHVEDSVPNLNTRQAKRF